LKGVDTVYNYNLNNPTTPGGGAASEPLEALFGKTASATVYWAGASSSYNAPSQIEQAFGHLQPDHFIQLSEGDGLSTG
jgi:hypothetical protein